MASIAEPLAIRPLAPPAFTRRDLDRVPRSHALVSFDHDDGRCVQLLTTADARELASGRLIDSADSPRADLSQITRALRVWPARCSLETDLLYARLGPELLGRAFEELRRPNEIAFITADPEATHPRFRVFSSLEPAPDSPMVGAFTTRKRAEAFAADLVDLFDLCRKHELLVLSPDAQPCVYKELGKCPAACDGSEPLAAYRARFADALQLAIEPADRSLRKLHTLMNDASAALEYELAEKLRARLARVTEMRTGVNHLAADVREAHWLALSTCGDQKSVYAVLLRAGNVVAECACARSSPPAEIARTLCAGRSSVPARTPYMPVIELLTRRFARPGPRELARVFALEADGFAEIESAVAIYLAETI